MQNEEYSNQDYRSPLNNNNNNMDKQRSKSRSQSNDRSRSRSVSYCDMQDLSDPMRLKGIYHGAHKHNMANE